MLESELVRQAVETQRQLDSLIRPEVPRVGRVAVYNNANQPINSGAWIPVPFNLERWDVGNFWNIAAPTRLTVPTGYAGLYVIHGHIIFAANGAGTTRGISVFINGGVYSGHARFPFSAGIDTWMTTSTDYYLSAGNWIELVVYQNTGAPLNTVAWSSTGIEFRMVRVSR